MNDLSIATTVIAALGCGLVAGVFFAFSTFVMGALARIPAPDGIRAMQSINVVVINPLFMLALLGTAAACIVVAVLSVIEWEQPESIYILAGSALYLIGTIIETMVYNVPRNEALAASDPDAPASEDLWRRYVREWTIGNHVRTAAAFTAAVLFTVALAS
jgi:uncharacterized membrane protein